MDNRIYFFANFGDWNKQPYGGGEVGNRRTLSLLKDCGYDIYLIEKYKRVKDHSTLNMLLLFMRMMSNIVKFTSILLVGRRKLSIVHIVGFYGPMVYFERILVSISKLLGYKTVYEMRGGGADVYYKNCGRAYKKSFEAILNNSDCIFSQGLENYNLIDKISKGKDRFYYPNFVMKDFFPESYPEKPKDRVNLFYFGRISETKNIDIILQTMAILHRKFPTMTLTIVGNHTNEKYYESLEKFVEYHGLSSCVSFYPACNHDKLKDYLKDKHFYLFPTTESHEGHSNAMTEAMAWGVIPIATSQGFNRSVIANDDLIVSELTPNAFADNVTKIVDTNKIESYSKAAYRRVIENYCSEMVFDKLKIKYDEMFSNITK